MEIEMQANENSKGITEYNTSSEEKLPCPSDTGDLKSVPSTESLKEDKDQEKLGLDSKEDDSQFNKNLNIREIHETSPFKQAVKGFVLSKLSKKVGSSHILSGLTEKLVKKLEDKDNSQSVSVRSSESDLSISSLKISEASSTEVISSSLSCELKSVVANDLALLDALNVEDAMECIEEPKLLINDDIGINIPQNEFRSNSISLPSSPAHRFTKRASSVSYSLENVELTRKNIHPANLSFLCEESKCNSDPESKIEKSKLQEEIELIDITNTDRYSTCHEECMNSDATYPNNVYSSEKDDKPKFKKNMLKRIALLFSFLKNLLASLHLSHFFLLASIIIHNIEIISSYLSYAFDAIVIAYVCYSYICILAQKPIPNKSNLPFVDPQLENASIHIQKTNKFLQGSVRILKGEYDPEMVKNHPTDLVDISIENCCLKVYAPKKKGKDASIKTESFTDYDLLGAVVSIVPKNLSKKRIWNKKYPLCITVSPPAKKLTTEDCNEDNSLPVDYLCVDKSEIIVPEKKALYLFALTDREKESLFWAIQRNTENSDTVKCNEKPSDTSSSKIDFSSMSYTSLLELNSDDNVSLNKDSKDIHEDEKSIADKQNTDLDFEIYVKKLFETFERMNKFTPRSRSFEDLSSLKDDISKSSDSFLSKDDSFLSSSTKEYSVDWLNLVLGRVFYDFLTQTYWSDEVKARIQKKLDKIEMPSFIESLEVSDVFLGSSLPQIHTVSSPVADVNGVWFNFDFNYCGSFQMTLKTKLKITKDKQLPGTESLEAADGKQNVIAQSSDSSDDEGNEAKIALAKKTKLINRIEKWISHKHFQTVAQSKFVKKYVGDLSNMPLTLTVELNTLHGTLTLNIPPAPTDRIWYGFRKDPVLSLNAYPKVGTHEINLSAVVQMIEKKLVQEFRKALVMPNMDDLLIPVMYNPIYGL